MGKTAIAEGLARQIVAGDVPGRAARASVCFRWICPAWWRAPSTGASLRSGSRTSWRRWRRAGDIILFIDELHTIIGAGAAEGAIDAANILKARPGPRRAAGHRRHHH
ncbi:MAG: hypothetical protein ACLRWQ_19855 [Flavonifractor plautii]